MFANGVTKFVYDIFGRTILSSHDDEDWYADDTVLDGFSWSTIASKHASLLFDYDDKDMFRSNSNVDFNSIADKMSGGARIVMLKWCVQALLHLLSRIFF